MAFNRDVSLLLIVLMAGSCIVEALDVTPFEVSLISPMYKEKKGAVGDEFKPDQTLCDEACRRIGTKSISGFDKKCSAFNITELEGDEYKILAAACYCKGTFAYVQLLNSSYTAFYSTGKPPTRKTPGVGSSQVDVVIQ